MEDRDKLMFKPLDFIRYIAKSMGVSVKDFRLPPIAVMVFNSKLLEVLVEKFRALPKRWLYREALNPVCTPYIATVNSKRVAFILPGWGAPRAVSVAEEMIACGVSTLFVAGLCGALAEDVEVGDLVLPVEAIIDEGTSRHYIPNTSVSKPDRGLVNVLTRACEELKVKYHLGIVWSTDAPYRETKAKVERYKCMGAVCVDMETSALYTLGTYRGVGVAAVHIVSDVLSGPKWAPAFKTERVKRAYLLVANVLKRAIMRV